MGIDDVNRYDDVYATKLFFAYMQYPTTEFYALPAENKGSNCRELLIAFGWLLATKNVMNIAVKSKLLTSAFSHEFSQDFSPEKNEKHESPLRESKAEANRIIEKCGRINHNIKAISESAQEKIELMTKIHAASLNTCGLPHLSVHEVALAKKSFGKSTPDYSKSDEKSLKDLNSTATMLETHMRWIKKQHVFHDWMVTVIEESKKDSVKPSVPNRCDELSDFVTLLRHVTKKKLHSLKNRETEPSETGIFKEPCVSRFTRSVQEPTETKIWIEKTSHQLYSMELDIESKMTTLTTELRKILESIKNCVEV
ncbi:uncharacterized protein [Venturia canescens]|nr:uncharacterized protein LOC122411721 isoform X2 [Venturia canescens]